MKWKFEFHTNSNSENFHGHLLEFIKPQLKSRINIKTFQSLIFFKQKFLCMRFHSENMLNGNWRPAGVERERKEI